MRLLADRIKTIAAPSETAARSARWLAVDRGLRLGVSFVVQLFVIRHLGPAGNGILQSGLALAALAAVVVELGLDGVVKRELVRAPERTGALLGTATGLRTLALAPCVAIFVWAARHEPGVTPALTGWLVIMVALPLAQTPEAWLLATGRVPANVAAQGGAFLAGATLRIAFVIAGAGVVAFGAAAATETLLIAGTLGVAYLAAAGPASLRWSWDGALARRMLRDATPLLITTLAISVYRRIDVVILARLLDSREAGLYAAAVRVSEIGYLAPMILLNASFPQLTRWHSDDPAAYRRAMGDFYRQVTWAGAGFATVMTVAAPWLVRLLFGHAFAAAAVPLAVHAWTAVFIAHGVARSQWLLLENRQLDGLWLAAGGAVANVALNFILVPRLGIAGAAVAAVAALAFNMGVLPVFFPRVRPGWALGWRATFSRRSNA
ncbi:MAG TPA: oligosaccharide flippase family protein [Opitutaceae bacterium]|nr:oligosaccharide flippase family protein [Opitutaceae bacterium]